MKIKVPVLAELICTKTICDLSQNGLKMFVDPENMGLKTIII
jgi:hypothetical protein